MQKTNTLVQCPAKLDAFQTLARTWAPHLSSSELNFLLWFLDATVSWGRTWLDISLRQMANEGLWTLRSGEPQLWQAPCPLSLKTLQRTLADLRGRGIIAITESPKRRSTRYTVNLEWEPPAMRDLPVPKRVLNRGAKLADKCGQIDHSNEQKCSQSDHSHYNLLESNLLGLPSPQSGNSNVGKVDDAEKVIEQIKSRPKKATPASRRKEVEALWKEAWAEGQYDTLPTGLSEKDRGQLSRAIARWPAEGADAVRWSITNWRQVIAEQFQWMNKKRPPARPTPGFLVQFVDKFFDAFAKAKYQSGQRNEAALTDEAAFARLIETGMTVEAAWKEMGKREAQRDQATKLSEEHARVAREYRALEAERKQLRERQQTTPMTEKERTALRDKLREQFNPSIPQPIDYSSMDNPPPIATDFGEWEDE